MPSRCVVGGCGFGYGPSAGQKVALHTWPKDRKLRKKWDKFVKETRKDWIAGSDKSVLCNLHFTSEDFLGYLQWSMGFKRKLALKPGTIPTIKPAKSSNRPSPFLNLLLSAAILFTGNLPTQSLRILSCMNVATINTANFFRHQQQYLQPKVEKLWKDDQVPILHSLKASGADGKLICAGDGRSDSPGHCAKYGSYTMLEQTVNKVLDIQVVQSKEVKNASWCELEGLKRSVSFLRDAYNLRIAVLITDRHMQIVKWVRENLPHTIRRFDIWHIAKCRKSLYTHIQILLIHEAVGKWRKSIVNHLYWCAASTPSGDGDEISAKWESVAFHVQNQHTDLNNARFPACAHPPLVEQRPKEWLTPRKYICIKTSPNHETCHLEALYKVKISQIIQIGQKCPI
uniref:THAP-type domain-containing protein n=1 Tax=Fundulus heteroclitus TaxID=8078 RepID=A0A3Q2R0Z0_FUNHE